MCNWKLSKKERSELQGKSRAKSLFKRNLKKKHRALAKKLVMQELEWL